MESRTGIFRFEMDGKIVEPTVVLENHFTLPFKAVGYRFIFTRKPRKDRLDAYSCYVSADLKERNCQSLDPSPSLVKIGETVVKELDLAQTGPCRVDYTVSMLNYGFRFSLTFEEDVSDTLVG